jgi:hypothetical protein
MFEIIDDYYAESFEMIFLASFFPNYFLKSYAKENSGDVTRTLFSPTTPKTPSTESAGS